ncbi:V-type ATP synthase subunit K [bacterium]|jgi:V/A-type H+-transporting ATPase subunit K|nr:V-type ATP synthase subunit K [bacterium]
MLFLADIPGLFSNVSGFAIAVFGAAIAAGLACCGSAIGVGIAGKSAAGVMSEKPELFGKLLVLQALPGTQGIYGFLVAILIMVNIGALGGDNAAFDVATGWAFVGAGLPIGLGGLVSAIYQGKAAAASIQMTGKDPEQFAKGITMTALVETYAILSLLVSILLVFGIKV